MKQKEITYCYPTSTNAKRFGFYNTGCYAVEIVEGCQPPRAVAGFATITQAAAHAEQLPEPWNIGHKSDFRTEPTAAKPLLPLELMIEAL